MTLMACRGGASAPQFPDSKTGILLPGQKAGAATHTSLCSIFGFPLFLAFLYRYSMKETSEMPHKPRYQAGWRGSVKARHSYSFQ